MQAGLITMFFAFVLLGGMLGLVFVKMKKIENTDGSLNPKAKTIQSLLPFKNIADNVIDLGDYNYRAIIEVSSINYDLKTQAEKDIIEVNFNRFINSLNHPISIFVLTRELDKSKILDDIKNDKERMKQNFPTGYENVLEIMENYYKCMSNIHMYTNNNLIKKKYIIVPFQELSSLSTLNKDEKHDECIKQLMNRCQVICSGICGVGNITAKILTTDEILKLLYSYYHREEGLRDEAIDNSEFFKLIVNNPNSKNSQIEPDTLLDAILCETQYKLKNELMENKKGNNDNSRNINIALKTINNLREKLINSKKGDGR